MNRKSFIYILIVVVFFLAWHYFPPFKCSIIYCENYLAELWHKLTN